MFYAFFFIRLQVIVFFSHILKEEIGKMVFVIDFRVKISDTGKNFFAMSIMIAVRRVVN